MRPLVFLVDGRTARREVVQQALEQAGYYVEAFASTSVWEVSEQQRPNAIIIAAELADDSGIALRARIDLHAGLGDVPVLMLADDVASGDAPTSGESSSLPSIAGQILSALQDALSQQGDPRTTAEVLIDRFAMKIFIRGRAIAMTTLEFRLIEHMARYQGRVFTRDALLDAIWGDQQFVTPRCVDACIRRIRRKMGPENSAPNFIRTVRGVGYQLEATALWQEGANPCECKICAAVRLRAPSPGSGLRKRSSTAIAATSCSS